MMRVQAIAGMEMYKHLSVERRNVFEVAAKGEATLTPYTFLSTDLVFQ